MVQALRVEENVLRMGLFPRETGNKLVPQEEDTGRESGLERGQWLRHMVGGGPDVKVRSAGLCPP